MVWRGDCGRAWCGEQETVDAADPTGTVGVPSFETELEAASYVDTEDASNSDACIVALRQARTDWLCKAQLAWDDLEARMSSAMEERVALRVSKRRRQRRRS